MHPNQKPWVAIHQPNFVPRLTTLTKIYCSDIWIVLDDVQFAQREYQNRCRLRNIDTPTGEQWLTIPAHLPLGRRTRIDQVQIAHDDRARNRVFKLLEQYFGRSPHWIEFRPAVEIITESMKPAGSLAEIAELSTRLLLAELNWPGKILRSSMLDVRDGRSERLADLTARVGGDIYLCGSGGAKYIDFRPFDQLDIDLIMFNGHTLEGLAGSTWQFANRVSSICQAMAFGWPALRAATSAIRAQVRDLEPPAFAHRRQRDHVRDPES